MPASQASAAALANAQMVRSRSATSRAICAASASIIVGTRLAPGFLVDTDDPDLVGAALGRDHTLQPGRQLGHGFGHGTGAGERQGAEHAQADILGEQLQPGAGPLEGLEDQAGCQQGLDLGDDDQVGCGRGHQLRARAVRLTRLRSPSRR